MDVIFSWLILASCLFASIYFCWRAWQAHALFAIFLFLATFFNTMGLIAAMILWVVWLTSFTFFFCHPLRARCCSAAILKWFVSKQPSVSPIEKTVLDAGGTWWEQKVFSRSIPWDTLLDFPITKLTEEERSFLDNQVQALCDLLDDWAICHQDKDLSASAWAFIKKERFWGVSIAKEYGGLGFSPAAHSAIVTTIATRSVSAAYTVMVPNSLGPGELISHFGTEEQQQHFLPRLVTGEEIPCFALTGTNAGSDAANLSDKGVVCYGQHEGGRVLGVCLTFDKRYITLAPVATLIGLAFHLYDPDHLLGSTVDLGINLALVASDTQGVEIGRRHSPMILGFMNGPISGKDVFVPLSCLLGDLSQPNQGWAMLIECLSIGRGISMPALSSAVAQQCMKLTPAYARVREQFSRPIGDFEGIKDGLSQIAGWGYLIQATRYLTTEAVMQSAQPTVASAISKYHLTQYSRRMLELALDIHGGHGLQMGPQNLLANVFNGQPISTVGEGANILTRNLMIFGQGVLRSHPFLHKEVQAAHDPDPKKGLKVFDRLLLSHVGFIASQFLRGLLCGATGGYCVITRQQGIIRSSCKKIQRMSHAFVLFSELALLVLGKQLKLKESLSAKLGDIFSHLYLAICITKYYHDHRQGEEEDRLFQWSVDMCLAAAYDALDGVVHNFPHKKTAQWLRRCLFPYGRPYWQPKDALGHQIADDMQKNTDIRQRLCAECHEEQSPTGPISKVESAFKSVLNNQVHFVAVEDAIKRGVICRQLTRRQTIEEALLHSVIDKIAYAALMETEDLRDAALHVDAFSPSEFARMFGQGINHSPICDEVK